MGVHAEVVSGWAIRNGTAPDPVLSKVLVIELGLAAHGSRLIISGMHIGVRAGSVVWVSVVTLPNRIGNDGQSGALAVN